VHRLSFGVGCEDREFVVFSYKRKSHSENEMAPIIKKVSVVFTF